MWNNIHSSPWIAKNLETSETLIGMQITNTKNVAYSASEISHSSKKQNELQLSENSLAQS